MSDSMVVGAPSEEEGANSSFSEATNEDQVAIDENFDEGDNNVMIED